MSYDAIDDALMKKWNSEHAECPICHRVDAERAYHAGDFIAPECYYWLCKCGHEWGHE